MRNLSRKFLGASALAMAGFFLAGAANAQIPVTDGAHIGINKLAWIEQYTQMYSDYKNQVDQIQNQVKELERNLVKGEKFLGSAGVRDTTLTERAETENIDEICGTEGKWSSLFSSLGGGSGSTGPGRMKVVRERQGKACQQMVRAENRRYNVVVQILNKIKERDREIERLRQDSARTGDDQPGRIQRNNNSIAQLQAQHALDVESAQRTLQAYDAVIETLKNEIVRGGEIAFSDKPEGLEAVIGEVARYGTLKLALQAARSRER